MSFPYIIQGENVVVIMDNTPHTINRSHITYQKVVDAIRAGDWDTVRELIEPKQAVISYGQGHVSITEDGMFWDGEPMHGALSNRMIAMLKEGFDIQPLVNFVTNLMQNPSRKSIDELYGFLEKNNLPITEDGHFLAYKKVRHDFKDCYTGTIDNSPGAKVEMPRNKVNDRSEQTCSTGLHFCSLEYLKHFGGERIVIVKVHPADVVSIPTDYNNSKARCCRYEVVSELGRKPEDAFRSAVEVTMNFDDYDDEYYNNEDDIGDEYRYW